MTRSSGSFVHAIFMRWWVYKWVTKYEKSGQNPAPHTCWCRSRCY